jgi:hypothetical protein
LAPDDMPVWLVGEDKVRTMAEGAAEPLLLPERHAQLDAAEGVDA